ncbi:MAG: 4Fe-4S dicluster domain-containing protein [bacterium]
MKAYLFILGSRDQLAQESSAKLAHDAGIQEKDIRVIDNLAERAVSKDPLLSSLFIDHEDYMAGASRPRAAQALLSFAGVDAYSNRITWKALPYSEQALKDEYGVPWFPVIDRSRCTGCGTCEDYCLFSVYTSNRKSPLNGRIRVSSPLNCKTGCPACSRLCPTGALIFPFCAEAALNGSVENPQPRTQEDALTALGADPHKVLSERRAKKRLIDPDKFKLAENDRILYSGVL